MSVRATSVCEAQITAIYVQDDDGIVVLAVWSAVRGRGPRL
jgi:hypothetical protein